jgi:SAM-dependent methyltransferase
MITQSTKITQGLISGHDVEVVLDLGQHAYADSFIGEDQLHLSEPVFPLQVALDRNSGHLQLAYVSSAQDRYNLYSYSYTSSNSAVSRRHWDRFAEDAMLRHDPRGLIVEIGSNDGYLLTRFQTHNKKVLGIDSSAEMCRIAQDRGILTRQAVFDDAAADAVINNHGPADLVIANNVLNHANDPVAFVRSVAKILSPQGSFIFEVPYWLEMMQCERFPDMIYHEHVSYFTVRSAWNLMKQAGLEIVDFQVVDYHGGSLRVTAQLDRGSEMPTEVNQAMHRECDVGLFDRDFYHDVMRRLTQQKTHWLKGFYQILSDDPTAVIVGVGAAAKANTWLTWHGLDRSVIRAITDASSHKQGKYTPLTRIPIVDDHEFAQHEHPYALILSWNIGESLRQALLAINPNTRFLSQ